MNFDYDPNNPIERITLSTVTTLTNVYQQTPLGWEFSQVLPTAELPYKIRTVLHVRYRLGEKYPSVHTYKGKIIG